jgi:hypothetical protein
VQIASISQDRHTRHGADPWDCIGIDHVAAERLIRDAVAGK